MIDFYDVAIIGAGPAGCACALALYGRGLKVVLIDKELFPRDKICGDGIPGQAFKAMDVIKPEWGREMRHFTDKADIRTSRVFAPNGKTITIDWVLSTYNSKRLNFDNFLLQLVRSETETIILEKKRLQNVTAGADSMYCQFQDGSSLRTSIVIGCDGANSIVRRQLDKFHPGNDNSGKAVRAYFYGIEGVNTDVNEFHFFENFPGYFWIFPLDNGCSNVGVGILQRINGKNRKAINLHDTLKTLVATEPGIAPRFKNAKLTGDIKGFPLPLCTYKRTISGNRFMLCGDAASLIDPLVGHGIDNAMWSGIFAAKQAVMCFKSLDFTGNFMRQFEIMVYKKIGSGLFRKTFILQNISYFPRLINYYTWLRKNQKLTKRILSVLKI
jgi:geranylgeranyl reductase family protein